MAILLDYQTVQDLIPLKYSTLRKLVSQKRIPHVKVGSRVFFDEDEIKKWIDERRVPEGGRR